MNKNINDAFIFVGIFLAIFIFSGIFLSPNLQHADAAIESSSSIVSSSSFVYEMSSIAVVEPVAAVDSVEIGTNIIKGVRRSINADHAKNLARILYQESNSTINYPFLLAVVAVESRFNVDAISPAGATGLGQLMPATAQSVAKKNGIEFQRSRLADPLYNIKLTVKFLERLSKRFDNDIKLIAAAYNGGPGGAHKYKKWLDGEAERDSIHKETFAYVNKVIEKYYAYSSLLQSEATCGH